MNNSVGRVGLLVSILTVLLFTPMHAAEAATGSLSISPANPIKGNTRSQNIFLHTIKPGDAVKDGVKIANPSDEARTVQIRAVDSGSSVDGSFSCRQDTEARKEMGKWVTLSQQEVELKPRETKIVDFTISVPKNASPGEHGGCITVQDNDDFATTGESSGIQLGFRSAIRLAVTVPGKIVKKLDIARVTMGPAEGASYKVTPAFRNSGNVSLDVLARAQLVDQFGRESKTLSSGNFPVMRESTMIWGFTFDRPFWGGWYKARVSVGYNYDPKDGIGENTSKQRRVRAESARVFIMPMPKALIIEGAVVVIPFVAFVWWFRRRRKLRKLHKHWDTYRVEEGDTLLTIATERKAKWKMLARVNKIKAPYALTVGQKILVPKPKQDRKSKKVAADEGWLMQDAPMDNPLFMDDNAAKTPAQQLDRPAEAIPALTPKPEVPTSVVEKTPDSPPTARQSDEPDDEQGDYPLISNEPAKKTVVPVPSQAFPAPADDEVLDWRVGADPDELRRLGIIDDASSVPEIRTSYTLDDLDDPAGTEVAKKPARKKPSSKSSPSSPSTRKRKS